MNNLQTNSRNATLLFWAVAAALLFFKLGATATWQSEDRWLEIAREMIDSGNIFRPTINGKVYFDKPLLSYWLELIAALFTGGINELAMRLPSAVAALIALWATINLGTRLWSANVGQLAGWILLTGFGFLQWARLGEADMENLAATIAAVSWYWAHRDRPSFTNYFVFYLIIAIGAQCKGLTAAVVPTLALLPDMLQEKRWRRHLNVAHVGAVLVAAAVYLLPFIFANSEIPPTTAAATAATSHNGLGLVIRENVIRYFAPFDHTGPIYTYLISIPQYTFPWIPVLIAALIASCSRTFRSQPGVRWTLWALLLIFLFFSLSGSRRNYYILPILPYCALLSARFLHDAQFERLRSRALATSIALLVLTSLLQVTLALPLIWPALEHRLGATLPSDLRTSFLLIGTTSLCSLLVMYWRRRQQQNAAIVATTINATTISAITMSAIILWSGFFFWQQLIRDRYRTEAAFAADVQSLLKRDDPVDAAIFYDKPSGRLLYYSRLKLPVLQLMNPADLEKFISTPPYPKLVLATAKRQAELPASLQARKPDLIETQHPWEKTDKDKLRAWLLTAKLPAQPSNFRDDR